MDDPAVHPVERPNLRVAMLFSFVAGAVLMFFGGDGLVGLLGLLCFGLFLVLFGVSRVAWVLREHERWRQYHVEERERVAALRKPRPAAAQSVSRPPAAV